MDDKGSKFEAWCVAVCAEIHQRFNATCTPTLLREALQDEPLDMFEDGETPEGYVDLAHGEYGQHFWVPVEL